MFRIGNQLINENHVIHASRIDNSLELTLSHSVRSVDGHSEVLWLHDAEAKAAWHYLTIDVPDQLEGVALRKKSKARVENGHAKLVEKYGEPMF